MKTIKKHFLLKVISVIVAVSFAAMDVSWALSAQSVFQNPPMVPSARNFKDSARLLDFFINIADYLLKEKLPLKYLESVMAAELKEERAGIDLRGVTIPEPGVVKIPYGVRSLELGAGSYELKEHDVIVALKNNPFLKNFSGDDLDISDKYAVKILSSSRQTSASIKIDKRSSYRYASVSMGGNKLAVSVNDGNTNIIGAPLEFRWDSDSRFANEKVKNVSAAQDVMDKMAKMIADILERETVDKSKVSLVSAALAGPVDNGKGIFGSDFKTANLPFDKYEFRKELIARLKAKGINIRRVEMFNDAAAALNGESVAQNGMLKGKSGGIVIVGGGINIAVSDPNVKEAGHNLYQILGADGKIHYTWGGDKSLGGHPIEKGRTGQQAGKTPDEAIKKLLPDYPVIDWQNGMRDFEDRLSGPNIRKRIREKIDDAKKANLENIQEYLDIEKAANDKDVAGERLGEYERVLTPEALKGNQAALGMIKEIADEMGQALSAFISAHRDKEYVKNLVLVSGVNENMGKGVYENDDDKATGLDVYIKTIRESAKKELVEYFKMNEEEAASAANGIVRSKMGYERELKSYRPTDEDIKTEDSAIAKEFRQLDAENTVASSIILGREAERAGQNIVIATETGWIPGYDEGTTQKNAMFGLIKEIEGLEGSLGSMGLKNVKVVLRQKGESFEAWQVRIKEASGSKDTEDLSRVIVLGSKTTSEFFEKKFDKPELRPFLAEINTENLVSSAKSADEEFYIRVLEMLSITMELARGKDLPGFEKRKELDEYLEVEYNKALRKVTFFPRAVPLDITELKENYDLDKLALVRA